MDTDNTIKVYVQTDAKGSITAVNSSIFLSDINGWIEIDSGTGDRCAHAQGNYFDQPIITAEGIYRYKLVSGVATEKTPEEISAETAALPRPEPTPQEDLLYIAVDHECRLTLLELGV